MMEPGAVKNDARFPGLILYMVAATLGVQGLLGSGGTVGAFGGAKAAAKASTLAFLVRIAT